MADGTERFSFVIRSRNEERWIGHAIQSVLDVFGPHTELIIVDNHSTDETKEVINLFSKRFYSINLHSLEQDNYTPGRSLNLGISKTTASPGRIIGILSAHCEIRKLSPQKLIHEFDSDPKCFGVMGVQVPIFRGKKITPRYIWENFQVAETSKNPMEHLFNEKRYFFHNAFSFIRREIWQDCPFDEDLGGKEDRYWAKKLVDECGYHFTLNPEYVAHHFWTPGGATWSGIG